MCVGRLQIRLGRSVARRDRWCSLRRVRGARLTEAGFRPHRQIGVTQRQPPFRASVGGKSFQQATARG